MLTQTFASLRTFTGILCLCLMTVCCVSFASAEQPPWKIGLAAVSITPDEPVWMAGYASRNKPSQGVLAPIHAKAIAFHDAEGHKALLLTADVIGYRREVANLICATITERTGLKRSEILLNPSHTHAGPVLGLPDATGYGLADEHASRVHAYTRRLAGKLADVAAAALDKLEPAQLSYARGVANFVMNRREFTDRGIRLGVNPSGYADRAVPVMAVRSDGGQLRAVLFGCACHNTTLGGNHYEICGDYAGFAQAHVEQELSGVQAMFMIGCGADANPYPRGTVEHARRHGDELGGEVCRVVGGRMQPIGGPLRTCLEFADLPLAQPSREELEQMAKGPGYLRYNATRMLDALANNQPLLTEYRAPVAVWQFGDDLTLVGLAGEVVSEFVPLLHTAIGHRRLWIAGYCNDDFGYIPTARILAEGGYETRCLIPEPGFFAPEAQDVLVEKVRQLAAAAGRELSD